MFWVYVIYSKRYDRYYIGQTDNLEQRLKRHNSGKSISTRYYRSWVLVYKKEFLTRGEAIKFERYLKSLKNKKYLKKFISRGGGTVTSGGS